MNLRFGAIIDTPQFNNLRRYPEALPANQQNWDVRTVSPTAEGAAPLGWVKQAPDSPIDVKFFKGKRGDNVIVYSPNATYIGLPGSKIVLPDTEVIMPGERLAGKVNEVRIPEEVTEVQTVTNQAMLLGGGLSSRFEPLSGETTGLPKPAVPLLDDESIARNTILHLKAHGFTKIIVHTFYLREQLKEALKNIDGVELVYFDDPEASGSAGGLYNGLKNGMVDAKKPILIIAGDAVTNGDLSALVNAHARNQSAVTIGVQKVADEDVDQFGIIQTTDPSGVGSGEIVSFLEKPSLAQAGPNRLGSTGIYVLSPEVYPEFLAHGDEFLGESRKPTNPRLYDYGMNFMPNWLKRGTASAEKITQGIHMWAEILKGYWNDVGNPVDYLKTLADIAAGKLGATMAQRLNTQNYKDGVMFWPNTKNKAVADGAVLDGNVIVATKPPSKPTNN